MILDFNRANYARSNLLSCLGDFLIFLHPLISSALYCYVGINSPGRNFAHFPISSVKL